MAKKAPTKKQKKAVTFSAILVINKCQGLNESFFIVNFISALFMRIPIVKEKNTESELLNKQIRHLLFINPHLEFSYIKRQLALIPQQMRNDKLEVIRFLMKERETFIQNNDLYTYSSVISKHVQMWSEEIGPVTMNDVIDLLEGTDLSIIEIAPQVITPQGLEQWLGQHLVGQPEYARRLALCFYLHKLRHERSNLSIPCPNLLVYGPSGVGKTFGPQILSEMFNLPFAVVNCNDLVQEGIVGNSLSDYFTRLYTKHKEKTSSAIIIFDEFDKLFEKGEFNERILNELLNIIDDNNTLSFNKSDESYHHEKISMKTNKMLFIFTGVFRGIEDIVRKRLGEHGIGFTSGTGTNMEGDYHQYANEDDFAKFFHRGELMGRIQQFAYARELKEDDLVYILLHSKESPLDKFVSYFKANEIELSLTEDGARAIAAAAIRRHLGVRGVKSILFKILDKEMFLLDKQAIIIDKDFVEMKIA